MSQDIGPAGELGRVRRKLRGHHQPARRLGPASPAGRVEGAVPREDRLVQCLQLLAGFKAQLLDQHPASRPVDRQRLGLAPGSVQRQHELAAEPLP